jgi:hypothetical protein
MERLIHLECQLSAARMPRILYIQLGEIRKKDLILPECIIRLMVILLLENKGIEIINGQ